MPFVTGTGLAGWPCAWTAPRCSVGGWRNASDNIREAASLGTGGDTNIDISADPCSARMPTSIGTDAEPVHSLL